MPEIRKRTLGRTGFEISEFGLGTWPLGGVSYEPVAEKQAWACVMAYLDAGGNFIDTATAYGTAQRYIGQVMADRGEREAVYIASKSPNSASLDTLPKVRGDVEQTLRELGTDYIDLFYLHWPPDDKEVMRRVLDEYQQLKKEGKIKAIGASIRGPSVTQETLDLCHQYIDTGQVDVIQVVYSILRQLNKAVFDYANQAGVGIVVRTALESGFLSGKYRPGHRFEKGHRSKYAEETQESMLLEAQTIEKKALKPPYKKLAQVALKFSLEPSPISSLLMGARTADQVSELLGTISMPDLSSDLVYDLKQQYGDRTLEFNPGQYVPAMMKE